MEKETLFSILESVFFVSSQPLSLSQLEALFDKKITQEELKKVLEEFQELYKKSPRGVFLESVGKGYQMRTKPENRDYLLKIFDKKRPFRLSRPALEVLTVIAYSQPCTKHQVDEIRGTDSGHLFRTLMEGGLICFSGKSDLPGKPSLYKTTKRFLEVFGFNSLEDLPSEEEVKKLIPQGPPPSHPSLKEAALQQVPSVSRPSFAEDEKESQKIGEALKSIPTSVEFSEEKPDDP